MTADLTALDPGTAGAARDLPHDLAEPMPMVTTGRAQGRA